MDDSIIRNNIQFCRQARGSLYELLDHLSCTADEDYFTRDKAKDLSEEIINCIKLLNGYIYYLKKPCKVTLLKKPQLNTNNPDNQ